MTAQEWLDKIKYALSGTHDWERIPFSTHHGWEPPDWVCKKCGYKQEDVEEERLPKNGCEYHPPEIIEEAATIIRAQQERIEGLERDAKRLSRAYGEEGK
jgi:hypothetical protein